MLVYFPECSIFLRPFLSGYLLELPSTQNTFARAGVTPYAAWSNRNHVSRHYPTFIAHTGSCTKPNSSHSLRFLIPRVFAGCCEPLLEDGPSRRYLCNLSLDAWPPTPAVSMVHLLVSSHRTSAFPPLGQGRHSTMSSKRLH